MTTAKNDILLGDNLKIFIQWERELTLGGEEIKELNFGGVGV